MRKYFVLAIAVLSLIGLGFGQKMINLADVSVTSPTTGDVLVYNASTQLWGNTALSSASQWVNGSGTNIGLPSGNVGVGTTNPLAALSVIGTGTGTAFALKVADSLGTNRLVVQDNGNTGIGLTNPTARLSIQGAGNTTGFAFKTKSSTGVDRVTILDNGRIGIGATSPSNSIDIYTSDYTAMRVKRSTTGGSSYRVEGSGGNYWIFGTNNETSDKLGFIYNSVTFANSSLAVNSNGNIGVGTISPSQKLDVDGAIHLSNTTATGAGNVFYNDTGLWGCNATACVNLVSG